MNSQQNTSFRLGRLSRTSDFRKHSNSEYTTNPKQSVKLAAINSINRGVRQLPKLRKQTDDSNDDFQYGSAHLALTSIRKKHDNISKQKIQTQTKIKMLKEEKEKYQTIESEFLNNKQSGSGKVRSMENRLSQIKQAYSESEWNKKSYLMLSQRNKADKVVYDQRKFNLEKELEYLKKQLKIFDKEGTGVHEETDRSQKLYGKLMRQLQLQQNQRQSHLRSLEAILMQKGQLQQASTDRKREIQQIAAKAMQDKDQNQKNWINILHVHKIISCFLRDKMSREMQKFTTVEIAFKNIKIATGVNDAQTLIYKFLNKQEVYGQLLSKIADNQKMIAQLKNTKEELQREKKELRGEKQSHGFIKKQDIDLREQVKAFEQVTEKLKIAELNKERIRIWLSKNKKKVQNIEKNAEQTSVGRSQKEIIDSFNAYLENLSQIAEKCQAQDQQSNSTQDTSQLKADSKLFRVKPKMKRKNSIGQQIDNQFDEEDLPNTNQQEDMISYLRMDVIKHNEKFMKDLKRKMDEIKKARIEAQSKLKAKQPQKKPKKIGVEED